MIFSHNDDNISPSKSFTPTYMAYSSSLSQSPFPDIRRLKQTSLSVSTPGFGSKIGSEATSLFPDIEQAPPAIEYVLAQSGLPESNRPISFENFKQVIQESIKDISIDRKELLTELQFCIKKNPQKLKEIFREYPSLFIALELLFETEVAPLWSRKWAAHGHSQPSSSTQTLQSTRKFDANTLSLSHSSSR